MGMLFTERFPGLYLFTKLLLQDRDCLLCRFSVARLPLTSSIANGCTPL